MTASRSHIGRPRKPEEERFVPISVTVRPEQREWLEGEANHRRGGVSEVVRAAVDRVMAAGERG